MHGISDKLLVSLKLLASLQNRIRRVARIDRVQPTGWIEYIAFLKTLTTLDLYHDNLARFKTSSSLKRYIMQRMMERNKYT